jgi:hypothetical protein
MPAPARLLLHFLLTATVLSGLSACAHSNGGTHTAWAGHYESGADRLQLLPSGEFTYDGGHCFSGDSDVGLPDTFAGRYRVEGRWLTLEPLTVGPAACSAMGLKLHALRVDGRRYLLDEKYLRALVNEVRSGKVHDDFPTWHVSGEPPAFTARLADWLPAPYAHWARLPPPSGQVIAIGAVSTRTRYGSAGLVLGEELSAPITVGFGRREGAFEGMLVCVPGSSWKLAVQSVEDAQATLTWSWAKDGGTPPNIGMRLGGRCP